MAKIKTKTYGKYTQPNGCIVQEPRPDSVLFSGYYISLTNIALLTHLKVNFLSMLFRGKRKMNLRHVRLISAALNMDMGSFIRAYDRHIGYIVPVTTQPEKVELSVN